MREEEQKDGKKVLKTVGTFIDESCPSEMHNRSC